MEENERIVLNYRKLYNSEKYIREIKEGTPLAFAIPQSFLIHAVVVLVLEILITIIISCFTGFNITSLSVLIVLYLAIPIAGAFLLQKIKPEGKKLYSYLWRMAVFFYQHKYKRYVIYQDRKIQKPREKVSFSAPRKVVTKNASKDAHQSIKGQLTVNENGRRVRVL
ncbi:TcpE family conjugal transfer membrane protein [Listeria costaricensis]|uniref:TcpE family conjugal transfer membrane protein n=1 Tax=Listeria costaricensis TaxID=2026604 RepID=UPI000C075715|nr:TcpE family conjugal transfer membrane protein [Listeria costaricensis]